MCENQTLSFIEDEAPVAFGWVVGLTADYALARGAKFEDRLQGNNVDRTVDAPVNANQLDRPGPVPLPPDWVNSPRIGESIRFAVCGEGSDKP